MNYSTCVCCPGCNMRSDWPLSLPLLATTYLLWDKTPPSHICQLSKGKKTLWKQDASFPIQYPIHTWCCPSTSSWADLILMSLIDDYFFEHSFQYVDQIVLSQTLARSLAQVCSKKLSTLYSNAEQMQSEQQNQGGTSSTNKTSSTSVPSPVPSITSER